MGRPDRPPITDPYGHPLTWGTILASHATLVHHAPHDADYDMAVAAYDSDGSGEYYVCPCQYHDALIEELGAARDIIAAWPGPLCGTCHAASCFGCGYVFAHTSEAAGRAAGGRLVCHSPLCVRFIVSV